MVTALESKRELTLVTEDAADTAQWMLRRSSGSWESRRLQLLDTVPGVIGYYSEGTSALAVDFYDDARAAVRDSTRYGAEPVVLDRTVKIRRGIAWASEPLSLADDAAAVGRLVELVQSEVVRPYRDTILTNQQRDPAAVGFRRYTGSGACGFCRMLADKGAVYREASAYFAAHDTCKCTAGPVFRGGAQGPTANAMQYIASRRRRTPAENAKLRDYIGEYFPD